MRYLLFLLFVQSDGVETRQTKYRRPRWRELLRIMKADDESFEDGIGSRGFVKLTFYLHKIYQIFPKLHGYASVRPFLYVDNFQNFDLFYTSTKTVLRAVVLYLSRPVPIISPDLQKVQSSK